MRNSKPVQAKGAPVDETNVVVHPGSGSIWSKSILAPSSVRDPGRVLKDSVEELKRSGSPYSAKVLHRRGENDAHGTPTSRDELVLTSPNGQKHSVATVEYGSNGYPAKLILGQRNFIFLSVASEEELVEELASFTASLTL